MASNRIVTIHQLNYLPWIGLFSKICRTDCFIILDNVQYTSGSVINRNKIRTKDGFVYLTIPIQRHFHSSKINEVVLPEDQRWKKDHWLTIFQNYAKAPYFEDYRSFFENLFHEDLPYLWQFSEKILLFLLKVLDIKAEVVKSSDIGVDPDLKRTDLLISLLKRVGTDVYLSGRSGKNYLEAEKFPANSLMLKFFDFIHPEYRQRYPGFEANMSVIDLLFNHGPAARNIISSAGRIE